MPKIPRLTERPMKSGKILGHSNPDITACYIDVDEKRMRRMFEDAL